MNAATQRSRPDLWLRAVPALVVVWAVGTYLSGSAIETELGRAVQDRAIAAALRQYGGRVEVRGRDVVIVADFELPEAVSSEATRAARSVRGVRTVRTEVATATALDPFRLSVRREPGVVELTGGVPPGSLHSRLLESALALDPKGKVDDRLAPGLGAPEGFGEAAEAVLAIAGHLTRGRVTITQRAVDVDGEAATFESYNAVIAALRKLPLGYAGGSISVLAPEIHPFSWKLGREGKSLTLSGHVPSEADRDKARASVEAALPGAELADRMQTARGLAAGIEFQQVVQFAAAALAKLEEGQAVLDGDRFDLSGSGQALDLLEPMPAEIRKGLPGRVKAGRIALQPRPVDPFRFAARRSGGRVTMTGFAPSPADRKVLSGQAESRFVAEAVRDELHIGTGAPPDFLPAATLALGALAELAEGEARLLGREVSISGRSLYPEMAERLRQRVASAVPAGWTGSTDIAAEGPEKPLETSLCGDLLTDVNRRQPVEFEPGKVVPSEKSRPALAALADVVRRCGAARIRVVARVEAAGDLDAGRELARARAAAVVDAISPAHLARLIPDATVAPVKAEGAAEKAGATSLTFVAEPP